MDHLIHDGLGVAIYLSRRWPVGHRQQEPTQRLGGDEGAKSRQHSIVERE
jgi:hypothetical protein